MDQIYTGCEKKQITNSPLNTGPTNGPANFWKMEFWETLLNILKMTALLFHSVREKVFSYP